MDYQVAINDLKARRELLDRAILTLEQLMNGGTPKKRGRKKGMSAKERAKVSERMKEFWKSRSQGVRKTRF